MIRAVVCDGTIRPLEPIPSDWPDGQEVLIEAKTDDLEKDVDELDRWMNRLDELGPARYDDGEYERMQAILDEADVQAKAFVRRDMGLE